MEEKTYNAGYEIISTMFVHNQYGNKVGIAIGYKEDAVSAYVTWECNKALDSFIIGHYFTEKEAAMRDFFERGMKIASIDLREIYHMEQKKEDIKEALLWGYGKVFVNDLVKNECFLQKAIKKYENLEHSAKSSSLLTTLEDLYVDMVKNHEIFDIGLLNALHQNKVRIEGKIGQICGIANVNKIESLSSFYVESDTMTPGKQEFLQCKMEDIDRIYCGNNILFDRSKEAVTILDKEIDTLDVQIKDAIAEKSRLEKGESERTQFLHGRE